MAHHLTDTVTPSQEDFQSFGLLKQLKQRWIWVAMILIGLSLVMTLGQIAGQELQTCGSLDQMLQRSPCVNQISLPDSLIYSMDTMPETDRIVINSYSTSIDEDGEEHDQGDILVLGLQEGEVLQTIPLAGGAGSSMIAVSPDDRQVATHDLGGLKVWDLDTGELLFTFETLRSGAVAFSPDGTQVASLFELWNLDDGTQADVESEAIRLLYQSGPLPIFLPAGGAGLRNGPELNEDGERRLYLAQFDDSDYWNFYSIDADDPDLNTDFELDPQLFSYGGTFFFSDDSRYLATTAANREGQEVVIAWDVETGAEILKVELNQEAYRILRWHG